MEAVFYDHATASTSARQADLRQALHAFLADAATRAAVHLVGLLVRVPNPSTTAMHPAAGAASPPPPSRSTTSAPRVVSRRSRTAQKLAWCAWEADRRLRQAAADAAEMNRWLMYGEEGCTASSGCSVTVAPVVFLAPQTRDDLVVFESWQRCAEGPTGSRAALAAVSRATRQHSPLRHAGLVVVSLGAPSLLLSWAEKPARCHLENLLLPHQSLLLDFSWWWCLDATPSGASAAARDADDRGSRLKPATRRDLFLSDVQPSLRLPKGDSRSALWISYASLLAALHPASADHNYGADSSYAGAAALEEQGVLRTHGEVRQLLSALSGSGAMGRMHFLRVVLSHGGSTAALRRQLVHVSASASSARTAVNAALLRTRSLVDVHALFGVLAGQDRVHLYGEAAAFVRTARRRAACGAVTAAPAAAHLQQSTRAALQSARVRVVTHEHHEVSAGAPAGHAQAEASNPFVDRGARALAQRLRLWERKRLGKKGKRGVHVRRPRAKSAAACDAAAGDDAGVKNSETRTARVLAKALARAGGATAARGAKKGRKRPRAEAAAHGSHAAAVETGGAAAALDRRPAKQKRAEASAAAAPSPPPAEAALSWSEDVSGSGA